MEAKMRLTKQGVRDLDFGWKKKPIAVAEGQNEVASDAALVTPPAPNTPVQIADSPPPPDVTSQQQ